MGQKYIYIISQFTSIYSTKNRALNGQLRVNHLFARLDSYMSTIMDNSRVMTDYSRVDYQRPMTAL